MHTLVNRYGEEGCVKMVHDEVEYGGTYMRPWLDMKSRFLDINGETVYHLK